MNMQRWGIVLTLVVVVAAARTFGRPPAPQPIRAAVATAPDTAVARGHLVFNRFGCTLCHGQDGKGGVANPNALREGGKVPAIVDLADAYKSSEVAQLIRTGRHSVDRADAAGAIPPYRMPGWGDRMSDQEVGDLVQYLMSLASKGADKKGWK
jgi:mono/diheme cytochrome c family protein